MIGVSSGTASLLGLHKAKCSVNPTLAYLILGDTCANSCAFCNRGSSGNRQQKLSRVSWPLFSEEDVLEKVLEAYGDGKIERLCFQTVRAPETKETAFRLTEKLRRKSEIPISMSWGGADGDTVGGLFSRGLSTLALPLDACTEELYEKIKKGNFRTALERLLDASEKYPGKITTHLIAGLGETEEEMERMLRFLSGRGISAGLFAFTPTAGSQMEKAAAPQISSYRRIQIVHWLIKKNIDIKYCFLQGKIFFTENLYTVLRKILENGEAFRTSGCSGCNRPFYNEKPGRIPYNYPEPLTEKQAAQALEAALQIQNHDLETGK